MSNRMSLWRRIVSVACIVGVLALVLVSLPAPTAALADGHTDPVVVPPEFHPYGKTYGEWGAEWYKYVFSIPTYMNGDHAKPLNPLLDPTGAQCGVGQSGPVFFLVGTAGGTATRDDCLVPADTALFFPILDVEDNIREERQSNAPPGTTAADMQTLVGKFMDTVTDMHVSVDGHPISNLSAYRGASPAPFAMQVPAPPSNNLETYYGYSHISGKVHPTVSDGYWIMLAPLPPGKHTITFGGTQKGSVKLLNGSSYDIDFSVDVTYNLTVVPTGQTKP